MPTIRLASDLTPALPALARGRMLAIRYRASRCCTGPTVGYPILEWIDQATVPEGSVRWTVAPDPESGPTPGRSRREDPVAARSTLEPVDAPELPVAWVDERLSAPMVAMEPVLRLRGPWFARRLSLEFQRAERWLDFLESPACIRRYLPPPRLGDAT